MKVEPKIQKQRPSNRRWAEEFGPKSNKFFFTVFLWVVFKAIAAFQVATATIVWYQGWHQNTYKRICWCRMITTILYCATYLYPMKDSKVTKSKSRTTWKPLKLFSNLWFYHTFWLFSWTILSPMVVTLRLGQIYKRISFPKSIQTLPCHLAEHLWPNIKPSLREGR